MPLLVKALFQWNECSKNVDISVVSNFLATFFEFFPRYREILPSTIYMPNFRSIGPFKQKLQRGAESAPPNSPPGILVGEYFLNPKLEHSRSNFVFDVRYDFIFGMLYSYLRQSNESPQKVRNKIFLGYITW